ncbi:MAG: hypothetical protein OHK0022_15070 [Roseiflexaceae bacterium]
MPGSITHIILKVAELCNLNCSYCYMYHHEDTSYLLRPKFMSDEVFEHVLLRAKQYCERRGGYRLSLELHGGEPTLIGAERLAGLAQRARAVLGDALQDICMQTNATLLDRRMIDVIKAERILVGVSLDGTPEIHDAVRVDHAGRGSHAAALRGIRLLQDAGLEPGVLSVVQPGADGLATYQYFRSIGITLMSYMMPDVSHDNKQQLYGQYGPTPVADYLLPIFDAWVREDNPRVRVKPFVGLVRMLLGGRTTDDTFGNPLLPYVVVETDGVIHGLDALRVCDQGIESSGLHVASHGFDDLHLGLPLVHKLVHEGIPLASSCRVCPEQQICGGGYIPNRYARANGFDNPSVWCQDILALIGHMRAYVLPGTQAATR